MTRFFYIAVVLSLAISGAALCIHTPPVAADDNVTANSRGALKILTLNMAHGRKDAFNQILLSQKKIKRNLMDIAEVIRRQEADVVALQEADGPSKWSGNFDHVAFLAEQAGYPWFYSAAHATGRLYTYGTAILSRFPIAENVAHTFKPSPPTLNKGFLLCRVMWKPDDRADRTIPVNVVSVHLDFSRKKVRQQQIIEIGDALSARSRPMVVLGDFNCDWFTDDSVVKRLADNTRMKVYHPAARHLQTFPKRGTRLDWILISDDLDFVSHTVLPDVVSDHLVVVATLRLTRQ
jgi:endonuclease/exonuclease/phosphatase family metal-dependent hydrolase